MFDMLGRGQGPDKAATTLAHLGSELTGDDRTALRRLLFDIDSRYTPVGVRGWVAAGPDGRTLPAEPSIVQLPETAPEA